MSLRLPDTGAPVLPDGRRVAASAERNLPAILALLAEVAPARGRALEIASGSGQQVAAFARAHPAIDWQPTDRDPGNLASITAWRDWAMAEGARNLRAPCVLDAGQPGWDAGWRGQDLVVMVNLLHLIARPAAESVLHGIAAILAPGGRALIYGPFLRDGCATSAGDAAFDAALRADDPATGYKDADWVEGRLTGAGRRVTRHEMPANNLAFVLRV